MSTSFDQLEELSSMMGIALNKTQIDQFMSYLALLVQEAQRVNITGIRDEEEIITKHFLDSLSCVMAMKLTPDMKVLDVGSGAGFPGVPLKIYAPEIQLTVLDSSQKHLNFLYKLRGSPSINCEFEILEGRAEEYGQSEEHREAYDLVVSRAVAKMNILAEYCLPLVKIGVSPSGGGSTSGSGYFIAMKGPTGEIEARDAEPVIQMLGGEIDDIKDVVLPDGGSTSGSSKRMLIKVLKIRQTPAEYPRRTGVPEKKPLN
ncbi:16S rRNA (guanine(527)-N(7))-methyltransferase RsmG [bacterium]|nr:16S rRNA (guanine(527)-N(7))-methyltransferase RsmG [bacterium]